jgi:hypothetical protein
MVADEHLQLTISRHIAKVLCSSHLRALQKRDSVTSSL